MPQKSYLWKILNDVRDGGELRDIDIQVNWVIAIATIALLIGGFCAGYLTYQHAGQTASYNPRAKDVHDGIEIMFISALGLSVFIPMVFRMKFRIFKDGFSIRYLTKKTEYSWADIVRPVEIGKLRGDSPVVIYYARQPAQKWYSLKYKNGNYISTLFIRDPATIAEIMNVYRERSLGA
jgi:hypothetical protein